MQQTAERDWSLMSEGLRSEVRASLESGEEMFVPTGAVSAEAVRFIRPGGRSMLYLRLSRGPRPGFDGDGRLLGIKVSDELAELAAATDSEAVASSI